MTTVKNNITLYMHGKAHPSAADLRVFVGMIETGEATYHDFLEVGGGVLASLVMAAVLDARRATA